LSTVSVQTLGEERNCLSLSGIKRRFHVQRVDNQCFPARCPQTVVALVPLLTFQSLRLTLRTASLNIQKFFVLPTMNLCVLSGSKIKQRLFIFTAITYRLLYPRQCLLHGKNWALKSGRYSFVLKRLNMD